MNPNMKGALGNLMRQAQQVQENLKRVQDEIARMEIAGQSGAGMVTVLMSGAGQARKVTIVPEALKEDREFLEDLVAAAINDAVQKLDAAKKEKMSAVTGGLPLPPGLNLGL